MSDYSRTYRVASVQAEPVWFDLEASVAKTIDLIEQAADAGAALVAFPECWVGGYPWWIWLGTVAWQTQFFVPYASNCLELGSPEMQRIQDAARANGIAVSLGMAERAAGSLYISQALIDADGTVLSTRRKLKPTHVERSVFGDGDGSDLAVADTPLGRVGQLCCAEHLQPLTKYAMYSQHKQLHIAAWPGFSLYEGKAHLLGPEVNTAASQQYAVEGQTYVIAPSCMIGEHAQSLLTDTDERRDLLPLGGGYARVYGPDGRSLGEVLDPGAEGLVLADLDQGEILAAKNSYDPVGHYSRPDVLALRFNDAATPRVVPMAASQPATPAAQAVQVPVVLEPVSAATPADAA